MRHYLIRKKINPKLIILENVSENTIGNLVYAKKSILIPKDWVNITILTNDIYKDRVNYLVKKIFEKNYHVDVIGCKNNMKNNFRNWTKISEKFWKNKCYPTFFRGVKRGDYEEIIKRLEQAGVNLSKVFKEKTTKNLL